MNPDKWMTQDIQRVIQDTLRSFGYTKIYKGYGQVCYSLYLAVMDGSRLNKVTHRIYEECANHFECDWKTVERNLRMASSRAWKVNPNLLIEAAGRGLTRPPTPSGFLKIVSSYIVFENSDMFDADSSLPG